jgi:hypothetical protein
MATEYPKRIHLKGQGRHEEAVAAAAITPGQLIKLDIEGKVKIHESTGGYAEKAFALEDALQGHTIDDAYSSGNVVGYVVALPGDVVYAWLAAGENVMKGDQLHSNGDGHLGRVSGSEIPLAVALEACDLSDSAAENTRIRVRIM